ncbi:MAG: hypothetical protein NWF08_05270 [Candidatus Bathyarchaeota archaeon]|nr:hypothetical protein [Candidatus Bathyarchaeota archaeon]
MGRFESEYYSLVVLILFIIFIIATVFFNAVIVLYPMPFTKSIARFFYLLIRAFLISRGLFPIGLVAVALLFDRIIQNRKLKIAVMIITLSFGVFFLAGVLAVLFWLFI